MTKKFGMGLTVGVVATILAGIAVWLTLTYSGAYNVAASDAHTDPVKWTLDTTMRRSVAIRADKVEITDSFSQGLVAEGAEHYAENCAHCHGAPGRDPAEWSRGMRPEPPHLIEAATEWSPQEIRWIVENGIKMTGMPSFGGNHTPEQVMALVAFVTTLPGLTPEDYIAMTGDEKGGSREAIAEVQEPQTTEPIADH